VGIDGSTDADVEQAEDNTPPDRHLPRPPDRPGQEPEGAPSRLEAHQARAEAKQQAAEKPAEDTTRPEASPPGDQQQGSAPVERKTEYLASQVSPESRESATTDAASSAPYEAGRDQPAASAQALAGERDTTDRQPTTQGPEQPGTEGISPAEATTVGNERAPADTTTTAETDQPTPADGQDARADERPVPAETAEQHRPQDLGPPLDQPEPESPDIQSPADGRPDTTAVTEANDQQAMDNTDSASEPPEQAAPAQETHARPPDFHGGTIDLPSEDAQRFEPSGTEVAAAGEDGTRLDETLAVDDRLPALEFEVEKKLVKAYGDIELPNRQDRSYELGDEPTDPTDRSGDRIVAEKTDKESRREKMRREGFRAAEDVGDFTKKTLNQAGDLFGRPPSGEAKTGTSPEVSRPPHEGINVGDTATSLIAAGVVVGELYRWAHGKLTQDNEEGDDGGDR
jgi:hypothetical protein